MLISSFSLLTTGQLVSVMKRLYSIPSIGHVRIWMAFRKTTAYVDRFNLLSAKLTFHKIEDGDAHLHLPLKFQFDESDRRLRPSSPTMRLLKGSIRENRSLRFRTRIRIIIKELKHHVLEFWLRYKDVDDDHFQLFTRGFATLISNADPDFLLESFLGGVPEETRLVLGKSNFTVDDVLSLPRLPNTILSEKGVYVSMTKGSPEDTWYAASTFPRHFQLRLTFASREWESYVGSACGIHGILQRWYDYIGGPNPGARKETGRHSRAIFVEGRTLNFRCLAHYGHDPIPWLTHFAESVFMIYLGTVSDSGFRKDPSSKFVHDDLYTAVYAIRAACQLDRPLAPGLNSTWSLLQGWKRRHGGIKSCQNCGDTSEAHTARGVGRTQFVSVDPTRPDGLSFKCGACYQHFYTHRVDRPAKLFSRTLAREEYPGVFDENGDQKCENEGCGAIISKKGGKRLFDSSSNQWKCRICTDRARQEQKRSAATAAAAAATAATAAAVEEDHITSAMAAAAAAAAAAATVPSLPNPYASPYPYVSPYQ